MDIALIVGNIVDAATTLLSSLGGVFTAAIEIVVDTTSGDLTPLGVILLATAGFALAWAGIRFVFGFINRLLSKTRAGK